MNDENLPGNFLSRLVKIEQGRLKREVILDAKELTNFAIRRMDGRVIDLLMDRVR